MASIVLTTSVISSRHHRENLSSADFSDMLNATYVYFESFVWWACFLPFITSEIIRSSISVVIGQNFKFLAWAGYWGLLTFFVYFLFSFWIHPLFKHNLIRAFYFLISSQKSLACGLKPGEEVIYSCIFELFHLIVNDDDDMSGAQNSFNILGPAFAEWRNYEKFNGNFTYHFHSWIIYFHSLTTCNTTFSSVCFFLRPLLISLCILILLLALPFWFIL